MNFFNFKIYDKFNTSGSDNIVARMPISTQGYRFYQVMGSILYESDARRQV